MMTTESTSQNFLLLLKKRNKRKGDASCLIPMNNGMWMGTVVKEPLKALVNEWIVHKGVYHNPS
jgi:hypothetical protein